MQGFYDGTVVYQRMIVCCAWHGVNKGEHSAMAPYSPLSDTELVASRHFTEILNCGKLTKPSYFCLSVVREICFMWKTLMRTEQTRFLLLQANSSCEVFVVGVQNFQCPACRKGKTGTKGRED